METELKKHIRQIPDFPKPGILFYDIGTLLANGWAWKQTIDCLYNKISNENPDVILAIESRGFLVGSPIAEKLGIGIVMVRKKGKLPGKTISHSYDLEYGSDTIEVQEGILLPGQKAVVIDDLLATGGTSAAAIALARKVGAIVTNAAFIIELSFLNGRSKLDVPVTSLITYES